MFVPNAHAITAATRAALDSLTIAKGQTYQANGCVSSCTVKQETEGLWTLTARVEGSEPWAYEVEVDIGIEDAQWHVFEASCTCPMELDCKHTAATLLYAAKHADKLFSSGTGLSTTPALRKPVPTQLDKFWTEWLHGLERQVLAEQLPGNSRPKSPPAEHLLYVLRALGTVTVRMALARPLKKGGYGAGKDFYPSSVTNGYGLHSLSEEDAKLVRRILIEQGGMNSLDLPLRGSAGPSYLKEILATGRCYWETHKGHAPLREGSLRQATAVWRTDPSGQQYPDFEISPPVKQVLKLAPLWYVDTEKLECGPLDTNMPDAVAAAWLSAPRIRAGTAALVSEAIAQRHPSLKLPVPVQIKVEEIADVAPVPCLRLYSTVLKPRYSWGYPGAQEQEFSFAALEFDYAGKRVGVDDPTVICSVEQNVLHRLVRNLDVEHAAMRLLAEQGFLAADSQIFEHTLGGAAHHLVLGDVMQWFEFARDSLPELEKQGWRIERGETFRFRIAEPEDWYSDAAAQNGSQWFEVELGVIVEGQKINLLPVIIKFLQMNPQLLTREALEDVVTQTTIPIALADGRLIGFPMERVRNTLGVLLDLLHPSSLNKKGRLKIPRLRAAELAGEADWRWLGSKELKDFAQRLRGFEGVRVVAPPAGLQTQLRPYQQEGLNWLQFLREYELSGVLADDMGLGKTIQALAHLLMEKDSGRADRPSLVVAPTSLMTNWRQETERFAPQLKVLVLHGLDRKQHFERIKEYDLVITSYSLLPRDEEILLKEEFHCLILDEAQNIKNPKTSYAQVACALRARHHLCLTGTPMENHLGELWSLFNFLLPGFLGDELRFNAVFRRPIEKANHEDRRKLLARRVAPFMLRRKKEEVVKELPPKTEIIQKVELTSAQRDLYESVRLAMHSKVKEEVARKGMSRSHIVILDALLKLRQICCHPQLLSIPSAKKVNESAKLDLLLDLVPEMIAEGRKILLFSQFTSMLALIQNHLAARKIDYVLLTGQTTDRATPIEQFQNGEVPLFLISLKAGGTGLNLTAADTVIHYDPWWNPAVENQATDRAHRIGQTKNVFVYKLLTEGTVEEKILALQERKRELVEGLLNEERKESLKLNQEDIDLLFAPLEGGK